MARIAEAAEWDVLSRVDGGTLRGEAGETVAMVAGGQVGGAFGFG